MAEALSWKEKYGRRFVANAVLLAVVWTLAWVWFNAHVKPHVSVLLFSGVSAATLAAFGFAAFRSFFDSGEGTNIVRGMLRSKRLTPVLIAVLPLLVVAYLTTFTIYFNAGKADALKLAVATDSSKTPVDLSPAEKQKAVSFFFAFRPVTVHVLALAPSGYGKLDVPLRRGLPLQLTVPDALPVKPFYLVRLVPLDGLFWLRGRKPDPNYVLRVFVPGRAAPIEHGGLSFRAIYLGAALDDLRMRSKSDRGSVTELRNRLNGFGDMTQTDIDAVVADWVDDPELIATPELKPGDNVRVELQGPAGKIEQTVKVVAQLNDAFLKGSEE